MAKRTQSFDTVTVTAESAKGMNIGDTVRFHAFNPRGLVKTQRLIDAAVRALVDAGAVKSGALMAYGSLDSFNHDRLLAMLDTKPTARELDVMITLYTRRNEAAVAFVAEYGGTVAAPVAETVEAVRAKREALLQSLVAQSEA